MSLLALDIPAYRLDVSAFAGLLNDGKAHTFSFDVVDADPARSSGVWYIDPVLILELDDTPGAASYSGAVTEASCLSPSAAARKRVVKADPESGTTSGSMSFTVLGWAPEFGGRKWVLRVRDWPRVRTGCLVLVEKAHNLHTPF